MGQSLHGSATTTEAVRRAIQHSQESLRALAKRYGINQKTVAKWKGRTSVADLPTGPREPKSTVLTAEEEAVVVAFRRHTLLPLDDCLYALQPTIPHLTRSSLHRCLQRHDISRLPQTEGDKEPRRKFKIYPIGFFHVDIAEVQTAQGKLYLFVAIDRTSKFAVAQLVDKANTQTALAFLEALVAAVPYRVEIVLTDNGIQFADLPKNRSGPTARLRGHPFDRACREHGIEHTPVDQAPSPLDQRTGRADEPDNQGRNRQAISLRVPRAACSASRRFRRRLQLRPAAENTQRTHTL
jgi:transposase